MDVLKGIEITGLGLFIKKEKALILGDLHLGQEEEMNKDGILIPRFQFKDICSDTEKLLKKVKPKKIILNGDLKHNFGRISVEEWRNVVKYLELLEKYGEIIIIEGNHDRVLKAITEKKGIKLEYHHSIGGIYICHGHEIPKDADFKKAKTIIIGHEHPAITLTEGLRTEKYKCFLKGKYKNKTLIVMPSMSQLNEGTDILREKLLSPFLKKNDLKNFEVYIIGEKPYHFGKIKKIAELK